MSTTTIDQTWRNTTGRAWTLQLTVSATDLTPDETAALAPVVAAIEQYVTTLGRADNETETT